MGVGSFAFRYQGNGATPCQYIDTTRKTIDCTTTLLLTVFGRPYVKWFALCYQTVVCLSVCNVHALWPNSWTDQDETWHAGRSQLWPHCIRWGPSSPSPKGAQHPDFRPYLLRPNGCMDQDVTWYEARTRSGDFVLDGDPAPPPQKGGGGPNFRPISIVAKRLDGSRWHLACR